MTKIQREKLEEMAAYVFPVFSFCRDGAVGEEKYVPIRNAVYLRNLAREIVTLEQKRKLR